MASTAECAVSVFLRPRRWSWCTPSKLWRLCTVWRRDVSDIIWIMTTLSRGEDNVPNLHSHLVFHSIFLSSIALHPSEKYAASGQQGSRMRASQVSENFKTLSFPCVPYVQNHFLESRPSEHGFTRSLCNETLGNVRKCC